MPKRTSDHHTFLLKRLEDPRITESYLNAALNDSSEMFLKALRNVAESRKMSKVAKKAGVTRESLYRMLSDKGNPRLSSLHAVLNALGLRIGIEIGTASASIGTSVTSEASNSPGPSNTNTRTRAHRLHSSTRTWAYDHQTATQRVFDQGTPLAIRQRIAEITV